MSNRVTMQVDGRAVKAFFGAAAGSVGVVLLHEFWGLNAQLEGVATRFAAAGVPALAVDLYDGVIAKDRHEASQRMQALDTTRVMRIILAGVDELHARGVQKVAVLGFCMGGALALAASTKVPGLDGAVVFYGIPQQFDPASVKLPLLLHFAQHDDWCSPERVSGLEAALRKAGVAFELHRYDAAHAFFNETRHEVHDPAKAKLAWERTLTFLKNLA